MNYILFTESESSRFFRTLKALIKSYRFELSELIFFVRFEFTKGHIPHWILSVFCVKSNENSSSRASTFAKDFKASKFVRTVKMCDHANEIENQLEKLGKWAASHVRGLWVPGLIGRWEPRQAAFSRWWSCLWPEPRGITVCGCNKSTIGPSGAYTA